MLKLCSRLQYAASNQALDKSPGAYDIFASVAISRAPVVAPDMSEIQKKFVEIQKEIEDSGSYKSNFELRQEKDKM